MSFPPLRTLRHSFVTLLLAGAAAGCSEPLAPESVLGVYRAEGEFLREETPVVIREMISQTVTVDAERVTRVMRYLETAKSTNESRVLEYVRTMTYRIDGGRLRTEWVCGEDECISILLPARTPDFLVLNGGEALIELAEPGGRGVSYRRVN